MKSFVIFFLLVALATDVLGLPVPLVGPVLNLNKSFKPKHENHHDTAPTLLAEEKVLHKSHHPLGSFSVPNYQRRQQDNILKANATTTNQNDLLVQRSLDQMKKQAHLKASDAHRAAAQAHYNAESVYNAAAEEHKEAGRHVAAYDIKRKAREHSMMAVAHQKESIRQFNMAHPPKHYGKPSTFQAIKSIVQSKISSHKAKKLAKKVNVSM